MFDDQMFVGFLCGAGNGGDSARTAAATADATFDFK